MKLCIREIDKYIERVEPNSALIIIAGSIESYPEAIALDIARRCMLENPRLNLVLVEVADDPRAVESLALDLALDLKGEMEAGRARLTGVSDVSEALKIAGELPDNTIAVIDATSGVRRPWEHLNEFRRLADTIRYKHSNHIVELVFNPSTVDGGWSGVDNLAELSDLYLKLHSEIGSTGVERFLDVVYFKRGIIPYMRLHYTLRRGGVEYSLRVEV
ncbi:MAG: hypothetical protein LRS46_03345 [Desulfurococcales archaeon]|nr:hypothetical protein [Desulfurococcales archaeon]